MTGGLYIFFSQCAGYKYGDIIAYPFFPEKQAVLLQMEIAVHIIKRGIGILSLPERILSLKKNVAHLFHSPQGGVNLVHPLAKDQFPVVPIPLQG
jgi:hypothetical protein